MLLAETHSLIGSLGPWLLIGGRHFIAYVGVVAEERLLIIHATLMARDWNVV